MIEVVDELRDFIVDKPMPADWSEYLIPADSAFMPQAQLAINRYLTNRYSAHSAEEFQPVDVVVRLPGALGLARFRSNMISRVDNI